MVFVWRLLTNCWITWKICWLKKINYFKTNENQALVGLLGGDVKNAPNKLLKSDSQRVAFSLCVGLSD